MIDRLYAGIVPASESWGSSPDRKERWRQRPASRAACAARAAWLRSRAMAIASSSVRACRASRGAEPPRKSKRTAAPAARRRATEIVMGSLVAKGDDRILARGAVRRDDSEGDSDGERDAEGYHDRQRRH